MPAMMRVAVSERVSSYIPWQTILLLLLPCYVGMDIVSGQWVAFYTALHTMGGVFLFLTGTVFLRHLHESGTNHLLTVTKTKSEYIQNLPSRWVVGLAGASIVLGLAWLFFAVNYMVAALALMCFAFDNFYSLWWRNKYPLAILFSGVSLIFFPVLGAAAETGYVDMTVVLLSFMLLFWAPITVFLLMIARLYLYRDAQFPLCIKLGVQPIKRLIVVLILFLSLFSFFPFVIDMAGVVYLVGIAILNVIFIFSSLLLLNQPGAQYAIPVYRVSWIYYFSFWILVLFDHYLSFLT